MLSPPGRSRCSSPAHNLLVNNTNKGERTRLDIDNADMDKSMKKVLIAVVLFIALFIANKYYCNHFPKDILVGTYVSNRATGPSSNSHDFNDTLQLFSNNTYKSSQYLGYTGTYIVTSYFGETEIDFASDNGTIGFHTHVKRSSIFSGPKIIINHDLDIFYKNVD